MTIDLSQLSDEKRMFLKAHPELLKSLEQAIPLQVQRVQANHEKQIARESKWQRQLEDAKRRVDELRQGYNPILRDLEEKYEATVKGVRGEGLVCPSCGESDKGNKMNGRAWCIKCNSPLVPRSKIEKWKKLGNIKIANSKPTHPTFIEERG